jgi:hypothetical protein
VILAGIEVKTSKAILGVFNGKVVCCNAGVGGGLIFLARAVVLVNNFTSTCFEILILAVEYR